MKLLRKLSKLFETGDEPNGAFYAWRKLASATEPVIRPPIRTVPMEETGIEKHDRMERIQITNRKDQT